MLAPFHSIRRHVRLLLAEAAHSVHADRPPQEALHDTVVCQALEMRRLMSASPVLVDSIEAVPPDTTTVDQPSLAASASQTDQTESNDQDQNNAESVPADFTQTSVSVVHDSAEDQQTSGDHRGSHQAVALAANGSYVVTWSELNEAGSGRNVWARLFSGQGTPLVDAFRVSESIGGDQRWARAASDAVGNFTVTWTGPGEDGTSDAVYARRFDSSGTALSGEFRVGSANDGSQSNAAIAMNRQGDSVIVWRNTGPDDAATIHGQRYNASGTATGDVFSVTSTDSDTYKEASVAINTARNFVVTWDNGESVFARSYDETGNDLSGEVVVDNNSSAESSDVAINRDGEFVVVWNRRHFAFGQGIYQRTFELDGTNLRSETVVNSDFAGDQQHPSIDMDADGNYVVAWEGAGDDDANGVYLQRYSRSSDTTGGQTLVNATTTGRQHMVSLQMLSPHHIVLVWTDDGTSGVQQVQARQFGTSGNTLPSADPGGPYRILEGKRLELNSGSSSDPDGDSLTFRWDLDGDGDYDDASGAEPIIAWSDLPYDHRDDGTYSISVRVDDGKGGITTATRSLVVINADPTITSAAAVSVAEGTTDVQTITATDPADPISFRLTGGADRDLFDINTNSGRLRFRSAPDFESPADSGADNVYDVEVAAGDDDGGTDVQMVRVTVTNRNDIPDANHAPVLTAGAVSPPPQPPASDKHNSAATDPSSEPVAEMEPEPEQESASEENGVAYLQQMAGTGSNEGPFSKSGRSARTGGSGDTAEQHGAAMQLLNQRKQFLPTFLQVPFPVAEGTPADKVPASVLTEKSVQRASETSHESMAGSAAAELTVQQLQTRFYASLAQQTGQFGRTLDMFEQDLSQDLNFDRAIIGSVTLVGSGLAVGSLLWGVRGGLLLSSLLAQMPVWNMLDPLVVLDGVSAGTDEGDSIQDIIDRQQPIDARDSSSAACIEAGASH